MESQNQELLNEIYQNATMGNRAIDAILPKVEDRGLYHELKAQKAEYRKFAEQARTLLNIIDEKPKTPSVISTAGADASIAMETLFNRDSSHIAKLIANGNEVSIQSLGEKMDETPESEGSSRELCRDVIRFEQANLDRLKGFQ